MGSIKAHVEQRPDTVRPRLTVSPEVSDVCRIPVSALLPADSPREGETDSNHVRKLLAARELPPILVHRPTMRVIDGMHRLRAAVLAGRMEIDVRFFDGADAEAFVLAVQANVRHGLQLSRTERSAAAERIMISHPAWSDRAIAAATGLAVKTVAEIRQRAGTVIPVLSSRVGLDGRVRPVDGADGRRSAAEFIRSNPGASLRRIAAAAGISAGTARDVRNRLARGEDPVVTARGPARSTVQGTAGTIRPVPGTPAGPPRADAVAALRADPSLRMTDSGRTLLRLVDNRPLAQAPGGHIVAGIPVHSRAAVIMAVRQCVDLWEHFLRQLERSAAEDEGRPPRPHDITA